MIGFSGLIAPSLDEMTHVAREMTRAGWTLPLLIGGTTASKATPRSRSHPVTAKRDSRARRLARGRRRRRPDRPDESARLDAQNRARASRRCASASRIALNAILRLAEARRRTRSHRLNRTALISPIRSLPALARTQHFVAELVPYIDWTPFFQTWEMKGRYPEFFEGRIVRRRARELFEDAQELLQQIIDEKLLSARGVYGFFPANSDGDDIIVYADDTRKRTLPRSTPCASNGKRRGARRNLALADFIAPRKAAVPTTSAPSPSPPATALTGAGSRNSRRSTTITTRSWSRRWPTAWRKRSPIPAPAGPPRLGLRQARKS